MTDASNLLAAALAGRYRVERELGRGGMATVYLVHDLRHDRPVALKVLRPELAASLGLERFLLEVKIAARLQHPHILPVHDSGEDGGFLWYTMPYVEGESLRQRLAREGQLPLDVALRLTGQILSALGYAHARGVIHRDIKPENILLEGDEAMVADFGVARAISASSDERLTATGLALGTPTYMSPEQATATRELDGRSDLYAVGCVLYEMLIGQPPFAGVTAQQLLARHAIDPVPSLRTVRATIPPRVETSVMRALAKVPADRFATAAEFSEALSGPHETTVPSAAARPGRRSLIGATVVLALAVAGYVWWPKPSAVIDPNLVAIAPFRVGGASPALGYLREGMIDLAAARLAGGGGTRAADPASVMAAWRKRAGSTAGDLPEADAREVARTLGAGQLLLGGVVGTANHVTLTATLLTFSGGRPRAEASVEGVPDSLPQLVDRLIAQLITEGAGASHGLAGLVNTPLAALRLYLEGRSAQRRADYAQAALRYGQALDVDSNFALAGMALATAAAWSVDPGAAQRGLARAWAARDRLTARDRALVAAEVGPDYPAISTLARYLTAWEAAVDAAPDQPDRWYELGDVYLHDGPYLQIAGSQRRAVEAFRRSIALDSGSSPLGHLLEIAVVENDTAAVRRLGAAYVARDSSGELLGFYRWRIADGLHDQRALAELRAQFGQFVPQSLWRIMNSAVIDGRGLEDAGAAAQAIRASAGRSSDWQRSKTYLHAFEVNRGRPHAALGDTAGTEDAEYGPHAALYERVIDALYGDGDTLSGGAAAQELWQAAGRAAPDRPDAMAVARADLCAATLWRLSRGELAGAAASIARLRSPAPGASSATITTNTVCAAMLDARLADASGATNARSALDLFDSLMRSGPGGLRTGPAIAVTLSPAFVRSTVGLSPFAFEDFANLEVARLRERQGDRVAALAAVRRRTYAYHLADFLARHLREEGRLAALTGDRAGAIKAYRHYLALHSAPEPSLQPTDDAVRKELAKLEGGR